MGKKGLSLEDKRQKILEIFHSKVRTRQKDVFNLKEIENLSSKAGLNPMQVKDILQTLLDDNLVDTDKIGIGNFYWSLPSKARQSRIERLEHLQNEIMESKTKRKQLTQFIENQQLEKPDSSERLAKLQQMKKLAEELAEAERLRDSLKGCTRAYYDECCDKIKKSVETANYYTDAIFMAKKFLQNKMPHLTSSEIASYFGVSEDLDYV